MNLDYKLIRSKRKSTALYVSHDGSLLVRAPLKASKELIDNFILSKIGWIEKQRTKLNVKIPAKNLMDIFHTRKVTYMGKDYALELVEKASRPLQFDGRTFSLRRANVDQSTLLMENWYRQQARQILEERITWFAREYQFKPRKLRISSARTRWGSCSSKGTVSFSWRLIITPPEVIDYVVVHELVHLTEKNHQKQFWKKVAEILPDYKERRIWLKKNGGDIIENTTNLEAL